MRQDLKRIREAVGELGYVPHLSLSEDEEAAYLKSGYECAFDGAAGRNLLEVQWAIQPHFYAVDLDLEELFRRAQTVRVAGLDTKVTRTGRSLRGTGPACSETRMGTADLVMRSGADQQAADLNWKWIGDHAQELGVVRILRVTLLLAEKLLGSPLPSIGRGEPSGGLTS